MIKCKKCDESIQGNYCSNCAYPTTLKKIDGKFILNDIGDAFYVNNGFFYTIKRMLLKPGVSVKEYIYEDRNHYIGPVKFFVLISILFGITYFFFKNYVTAITVQPVIDLGLAEDSAMTKMLAWSLQNTVYTDLFGGLLVTFGLKLFFRKYGYNIFEIFTLVCYVYGIATLLLVFITVITGLTKFNLLQYNQYITTAYFVWAIAQFFDKKKMESYIKAFLSFMVGSVMVLGVLILIGFVSDVLK